jgi:hypothetical protein
MLQNVWHSGGIWWICLEANGKDIVRIVARNVQVLGAGLVMLQVKSRQLKLRHLLDALESEAMELLSGLGKVGDVCYCRISSLGNVCRSQ